MSIPRIAVRRPVTVFMVFLSCLLIGAIALTRLQVELMPNTALGFITIRVDIRGGMPPVEVENLVTRPIEDVVSTVGRLREMVSISEEGRSEVRLGFESDADMDIAGIEVREAFAGVRGKLPDEAEKPVIAKFSQGDFHISNIAVFGTRGEEPEEVRKIVDDEIKDRFSRIEGVAKVEVWGGRERKILVETDKARLVAHSEGLERLVGSIGSSNQNLLAGLVQTQRRQYVVRTIGRFEEIAEIEQVGVEATPQSVIVRVKQMSSVEDSFLEPTGFARVDKKGVVTVLIYKESAANTIEVSEVVNGVVEELRQQYQDKLRLVVITNRAEAILEAIALVRSFLISGALLAMIVLFLFLREFKSTIIVALSIPTSVMITFAMMFFNNLTLNLMTLSGLALGIGMLVDNAIVVLENIHKKMSLANKRYGVLSPGREKEVISLGAEEMFLAMVASTITTLVVFLPLMYVSADVRKVYLGLALTVTFALISSLAVAVSLVPVLVAHMRWDPLAGAKDFMRNNWLSRTFRSRKEQRAQQRAAAGILPRLPFFTWILRVFVRSRYLVILVIIAGFAATVLLMGSKLKKELAAGTSERQFTIFIELATGVKLDLTDEVVADVEQVLQDREQFPEIETVSARVEPWSSKIYVKIKPREDIERSPQQVIDAIKPFTEEIEKKYYNVRAFIFFEELTSGEEQEVSLDVFGHSYETLTELLSEIGQKIGELGVISDIKSSLKPGRPELLIRVDKQKAAYFGLTVDDIANSVHAQMKGLRATTFHTEGKEVEVIVRLQEKDRKTFDDVYKLLLVTPRGDQVYLEQVADFELGRGPSKIFRKNKSRMATLSGTLGRVPYTEATDQIKAALAEMEFPRDYYWKFAGDYYRQIEIRRQLVQALLLMLVLVYMVLAALFESYLQPMIILLTVPLAALGVIWVLFLSKTPVSMGVIIGAILLGGIVVNSAIILVDHTNNLVRRTPAGRVQRRKLILRAVLDATTNRVRPILMTACTTILGLLPLAMDQGEQSQLWAPLAITVCSGLTVSTILTLFVLPCIYMIFEDVVGLFGRILLWIRPGELAEV
ncbi:MAG: efflux RND transporter permease subunit [Candidatus Omnitrophica bacterium]|nr:efflux RND transporter permease subunit [Candidatus Omnitrophota bacterium]